MRRPHYFAKSLNLSRSDSRWSFHKRRLYFYLPYFILLFAIEILIPTKAGAFIVEAIELSRDGQRILLLGDNHFLGSLEEVKEQSNELHAMFSKLDEKGKKIRFLYESSAAFSLSDNCFSVSESGRSDAALKYDINGTLNFFMMKDSKVGTTECTVKLSEYEVPHEEISNLFYLVSNLYKFNHFDSRSFDSRLPLTSLGRKIGIRSLESVFGCVLSGVAVLNRAKSKITPGDYEKLTTLNSEIISDSTSQQWIKGLSAHPNSIQSEDLADSFSSTKLLHTIDVGVLTDILSHQEPFIIVYGGLAHTDYIGDKLMHQFGFRVEQQVGIRLEEALKFDSEMDQQGRIKLNRKYQKTQEELKSFFESFEL